MGLRRRADRPWSRLHSLWLSEQPLHHLQLGRACRQQLAGASPRRGRSWARCQRSSCSCVSAARLSKSRRIGRTHSGRFRDTFSSASPARMRTRISGCHRPATSSGSHFGCLSTVRATSSARPVDRQSPWRSLSRRWKRFTVGSPDPGRARIGLTPAHRSNAADQPRGVPRRLHLPCYVASANQGDLAT